MFFGERVPYTNFHDLNLDELIKTMLTIRDNAGATADKLQELLNGGLVTSVNGMTGDVEISVVGADTSIVNVKTEHGAAGDGVTDDTDAIQTAIEHARTSGKILYFPKGVYALGHNKFNTDDYHLAAALHVYSGMTILGEGATLKATDGEVTHIMYTHNNDDATGYNGCQNVYIKGVNFDGNSDLEQAITLLSTSHARNIVIDGCTFSNCRTWHNIEINSSEKVIVTGCIFNPSTASEDIQIDKAGADLGNIGQNDGTVCQYIEITGCNFTAGGNYKLAVGNHSDGAHHNILIHDNIMVGPFSATNGTPVNFVSNTYQTFTYNNNLISADIPRNTNTNQFNNIFNGKADVPVFPNDLYVLNNTAMDLNTVFTSQRIGSMTISYYVYDRDINGPSGLGSGIFISIRNPSSGNYGSQYILSNNREYKRRVWKETGDNQLAYDQWRPILGYHELISQIVNDHPTISNFTTSNTKNNVKISNWNLITSALNFYMYEGSYTQNQEILSGFPIPEKPIPIILSADSLNIRCVINTSGSLIFDENRTLSSGMWVNTNFSYLEYVPIV